MDQQTQLVLFSTDRELIAVLKQRFNSESHISAVCGTGPEVGKEWKLDALWLTPMQAHYFGIADPLPPYVAKVFVMPTDKRKLGLPRLLIAGVVLEPGKTYSATRIAHLCAEALADAIADYNSSHQDSILRVGSVPENLGLGDLNNTEAFLAIRQVFSAPPESSKNTQVLAEQQTA